MRKAVTWLRIRGKNRSRRRLSPVVSCLFFIASCLALPSSVSAAGLTRLDGQFERIGPYGGDVRSLLIDNHNPDSVYLGTANGQIYKSGNAGASWRLLFPGIGKRSYVIDTLVQHPVEPEHLYAGAWDLQSKGGGLFESRDGGSSWVEVVLPEPSTAVRGLAICKTRPAYMIVGTLAAAYVSDDSGKTWHRVGGDSGELETVESVAIDPREPQFLFIGTWRLGYRSTDFGKTWTRMSQGIPLDSDMFSIAIDDQTPETVYSSACSGVYRSTNRGLTWSRFKLLPDRFTVRAHLVYRDPTDSHRIYVGTTEGLFASPNDGQTWNRLTSSQVVVNALGVNPKRTNRILLGTENQGVLRSDDGGRTWNESNNGFVHRRISRVLFDPQSPGGPGLGALSNGGEGGWYLRNGHENEWVRSRPESAFGTELLSVLSLPGKLGRLAGTVNGLYWQQSPSAKWKKIEGFIAGRTVFDLAYDPRNAWVFAGTDKGVYRASPKELQFRNSPKAGILTTVFSILVSKPSPSVVYAATSLGVIRSSDAGIAWQVVSSGLPYRAVINSLAACPAEREHLIAGTSLGLYESRNGAASWQKMSDGRLSANIPAAIFLDPSGEEIIAADGAWGGVFLSSDGGRHWDKIEAPQFSSPISSLAQDPGNPARIYLGTGSDGVYLLRLDENDRAE